MKSIKMESPHRSGIDYLMRSNIEYCFNEMLFLSGFSKASGHDFNSRPL